MPVFTGTHGKEAGTLRPAVTAPYLPSCPSSCDVWYHGNGWADCVGDTASEVRLAPLWACSPPPQHCCLHTHARAPHSWITENIGKNITVMLKVYDLVGPHSQPCRAVYSSQAMSWRYLVWLYLLKLLPEKRLGLNYGSLKSISEWLNASIGAMIKIVSCTTVQRVRQWGGSTEVKQKVYLSIFFTHVILKPCSWF